MEVDGTTLVLIELLYKFVDFFLGWLETKSAQCDLEFFWLNCTRSTRVEQVKGVLNLLLLRLCQILFTLGLLLDTRGSSCWCCRYL